MIFQRRFIPWNSEMKGFYPGGALPYITYTGMCRPTGSWFWSSWFRKGYPFQRRFLERGIIFRTHESSSFVSSHLKLFKDRLLLKIRFNALTSKLLYSCCILERSIKNWPISILGRILKRGIKIGPFPERGINFRGNFFQNEVPIWSPGRHIPT